MSAARSHPRVEAHNLDPERLPAYLPQGRTEAHLVEPVLAAIQAAVADCSVTAATTSAGWIYTRKTEQTIDEFGQPRNQRYGSDHDDVFLHIGVRVSRHAAGPVMEAIRTVEALSNKQLLREAEARLAESRTRLAVAQAEEVRIQAEVEALSTMRDQYGAQS
jgi:hypothetical protein